jgi:hypothetical protein
MEEVTILQTVSSIFAGVDLRDWAQVQDAMAENVRLDYSSLSGNPAATLPSGQIIQTWKGFLPGFDRTHHQLSGFIVDLHIDKASVTFYGKADHFIGSEVWTVEGSYDAELEKKGDRWFVTLLTFHLASQAGNTGLPAQAIQNVKSKS